MTNDCMRALESFKTASGMNSCAMRNIAEGMKASERMGEFQNRKRYELVRNVNFVALKERWLSISSFKTASGMNSCAIGSEQL